jgi:hypothetical protein
MIPVSILREPGILSLLIFGNLVEPFGGFSASPAISQHYSLFEALWNSHIAPLSFQSFWFTKSGKTSRSAPTWRAGGPLSFSMFPIACANFACDFSA